MKNRMFFGTSILDGFWEGFGRGLGGQQPLFSHFFQFFFDVKIGRRFENAKIEKKQCQTMKFQPILGLPGGMCGVLGREKERGSEACWDRILETNIF